MNSILGAKESTGAKPTTIFVKQSRFISVCSLLALESQPHLTIEPRTVYQIEVVDEEKSIGRCENRMICT